MPSIQRTKEINPATLSHKPQFPIRPRTPSPTPWMCGTFQLKIDFKPLPTIILVHEAHLFVLEFVQQCSSELFGRNVHLLNVNNGISLEITIYFSGRFLHTLPSCW